MTEDDANPSRRALMRSAGAVALAAVSGALGAQPEPVVAIGPSQAAATPDVHIELEALVDQVPVREGKPTRVWRYRGKLLRGGAGVLEPSAGGYLGPLIRVRRGQRLRVDLVNRLPEPTIIHWHGLHVPDTMDGHSRFTIGPGERYVYEFDIVNRAGSYWFHPHPHGRTGAQVYFGLAGLLIVHDGEEQAAGLPSGDEDVCLVVQDRTWAADNQWQYLSEAGPPTAGGAAHSGGGMGGMMGGMRGGGMARMMERMMGVLGDDILVNGRPDATLPVSRRAYRLRLFNLSNTRTCKLAWTDGTPLTVIATDGGLLAAPAERKYLILAPAERADVWVDFGRWPDGSTLKLRSLPFDGGVGMGMMGGADTLPDGAPFEVLTVHITGTSAARAVLPERLAAVPPASSDGALNADSPKVFRLTMGMMAWGINGKGFDMLGADSLETVKLGTQEVWEFRNDAGMMQMPHSIHVHGLQFRVLARSVSGPLRDAYRTVAEGFVDEGWKDSVLIMPGERVRLLLRFEDYAGLFLYHCHMLEHEDAGLMRNYRVVT